MADYVVRAGYVGTEVNSFQLIRGNVFRAIELVAGQAKLVGYFDVGLNLLVSKIQFAHSGSGNSEIHLLSPNRNIVSRRTAMSC